MTEERKRFKTPKPAPMSNLVPMSDYIVAQRMAKIQEQLHEIQDADFYKAGSDSIVEGDIARLKAKRDAIWAERDKQEREYAEWIARGRPNIG